MTDGERLKQFHADFEKLKHNRDQVPLDILTTKYAAAYNAQVKKVQEGADWFFSKYLETLAFPTHPKDEAGNKWLADCLAILEADEKKPGGLRDQAKAALIDRLDLDEYENLVWQAYARRLQRAFATYWRRHCRWVGEPPRRWIYNDIFKKYWWPKSEEYPGSGCWINRDYTGQDFRFPPDLKEETI